MIISEIAHGGFAKIVKRRANGVTLSIPCLVVKFELDRSEASGMPKGDKLAAFKELLAARDVKFVSLRGTALKVALMPQDYATLLDADWKMDPLRGAERCRAAIQESLGALRKQHEKR